MTTISWFSVYDLIRENYFLKSFHSDSPNISLEYYDVQRIEGYPAESFSQGEILQTMHIRVLKIEPKRVLVAMATYMRSDWWNRTFLNGNT